jgi:hypothetical protein
VTAPPDCEPNWRDNPDALDALLEYGAQQLSEPVDPRLHDLRGQGRHGERLTEARLRAITDIPINQECL